MRVATTLVVSALVTAPLWGQTPPPAGAPRDQQAAAQVGTASMTGTALITINNQPAPIRRARVTLRENGGTVRTTDTDTLGQFRVDQLPAGTYKIEVDKPGFVPIGHMPVVQIPDGSAAKTTVVMRRGAAIEGRIVTAEGEPAMGLTVSAVRLGYGPYGKKAIPVRQTTTDDLGRFRLHTLTPGDYYIEAAPDPLRTSAMPGSKPTRTYYPGTPRLNDAQVIALIAEQQLSNITVRMAGATLATVSANVTTADGKPPATFSIRMQRVGAAPGEVRCLLPPSRPGEASRFQCPSVPPGDFRILVTARSTPSADVEFAAVPVTVEGRDLLNLSVMTAPGVPVNGRVEADGGGALPANLQIAAMETDFEFPSPIPSSTTPPTPPVSVAADGGFTFASIAGPRLFRCPRLPEGWALKGVWLDGAEISDLPTAFIASDRPPVVRIVLTHATGAVGGMVRNADGQPASGTSVIVFADDVRRWTARSRFIRTAEIDVTGRYAISGLLPGNYKVAFVDDLADGAWEDPDVLARLNQSATPIVIALNQQATLDWRIR